MTRDEGRVPVLYLAPWVDYGGSDTGTIEWFRWLDRERYRPSLITTQPSPNRRLTAVEPYAAEVWALPDLMPASEFPGFILDFIHSRGVRVVHIMNSRLAYNLLPDLRRLPTPPVTVVQLHVEEPDRSGYVRYVCTRYGNLVDAFTPVSQHLADALVGYEVPRSRCRVIHLGVDAEWTFSPARVRPVEGLGDGRSHILFPARLVPQKDPLLMVDVADRLRRHTTAFQVHCVGDGILEPEVRAAITERGLGAHVVLHGASSEMPRWYAACDLVLMTSDYEGVPSVAYESMAMGIPLVAPALPGNRELLGTEGGTLIEPRDDAGAYADALAALMDDPQRRRRLGATLRARALEQFSLASMGEAFSSLYDELLASTQATPSAGVAADGDRPQPLRLRSRTPYGRPLVSIVIPCFNHGHYLESCLQSIDGQVYPNLEVVVVDDASTDPETVEVLATAERRRGTTVLRMPQNSGPSAARNAGIVAARGRFVLPVDADNLLLPNAVTDLVDQLQTAGERIGYVYPNQQFFGNRKDYFEAPLYNMHSLLTQNFCDTCSLIDRELFARGLRYGDDIRFGHEDWDLVLQLAEREVYGEPARTKTLLTRKSGFTRCDLVDHGSEDEFVDRLRERHVRLFDGEPRIKGHWSPALTLAALDPVPRQEETRRHLADAIAAQTCEDAEIILRYERTWDGVQRGPHVRRVHPELAVDEADAVAAAVSMARGAHVCVSRGWGLELLGDPAGVEKLMRLLRTHPGEAVVLVDSGATRPLLAPVDDRERVGAPIVAVAWDAETADRLGDLEVGSDDPLARISEALASVTDMRWHHVGGPRSRRSHPPSLPRTIRFAGPPPTPGEMLERRMRLARKPRLPSLPDPVAPAWKLEGTWRPPLTRPLFRHRHLATGLRTVTHDEVHGPGWIMEHDLGSIQLFPLQGTSLLVSTADAGYDVVTGDEPGADQGFLGFLEAAGILPLVDPLYRARHRVTGQTVLVAGEDDPLLPHVDVLTLLGYIEPCPIRPRRLRPDGSHQALAALDDANVHIDHLTRRTAELDARIDRIVRSLPARIYRKVMWIPGVRRVLLWRRH